MDHLKFYILCRNDMEMEFKKNILALVGVKMVTESWLEWRFQIWSGPHRFLLRL
jgi:hypothetical protein